MPNSDFLNEDLAVQCNELAGEINKLYQHLPWAAKNEAVARLKRQIHQLAEEAQKVQESQSVLTTQSHLKEAISLIHECVPLLDLCLRKILVSPELHSRWIKRLNELEISFSSWLKGISAKH
jgi:predicted GTPase